ncbi:uncharacterized protein SETTUDRAFT_158705 [Exserohilum turcica Et28A]|uniref:Peroxidase n=1 Tax=Exserohilum turcicum (strain 28A) TaxID=671987 RepID=R0KQG9_EXST2|nr:uncharacterized protein SETTUDRAFT_158705 [Exserohilum turcica Et28A]EOA90072.1 hypothetical protein SETTUDRAFT_158705 [Exserohilum turcica Et28A]
MRFSPIPLLAVLAATPILAEELAPRYDACPPVWKDVVNYLKPKFSGCSRSAHKIIRAAFHDCINNGCDGSLALSDERTHPENQGLQETCELVVDLKKRFSVSAADAIQFGAALAIASCPLGPRVRALVGRHDHSQPAERFSVPSSRDSVNKILVAFDKHGLSPRDVVALLGIHSAAFQEFDIPSLGVVALDSTPYIDDMRYYQETIAGTAPHSLQSDRLMTKAPQTKDAFAEFASDAYAWNKAFVEAFGRLSTIGNEHVKFTDCSHLIPNSPPVPRKRQIQNLKFTQKLAEKFGV